MSVYERPYILPYDFTPKVKKEDPYITKFALKELVENGVVTVVYVDRLGNEASIKATLLTEYIPKQDTAKLLVEQTNKNESSELLSVWDVDAKGWRTVQVNQVKSVA